MRIFKNAWFVRFARRQAISDDVLTEAIRHIEKGQVDADLGGGVFKQRVARLGQGKSGGYRTIILYRATERAFFVYAFAKSDRDNIDKDEADAFRKAAKHVFDLSAKQLNDLIENGKFVEIDGDEDQVPQ